MHLSDGRADQCHSPRCLTSSCWLFSWNWRCNLDRPFKWLPSSSPCLRRTRQVFPTDPHELVEIGERVGFDGAELATASRLVAKVDSAAVQDGFQLYMHGFIVTDEGRWAVVQQGMNGDLKQARRYHWLSEGLSSFVDEPHAAIEGPGQGEIVNLTDHRAELSRQRQLDLLGELGPDGIARKLSKITASSAKWPAGASASRNARPSRCPCRRRHCKATVWKFSSGS